MLADEFRFAGCGACRWARRGRIAHGQRQRDANALRAFDHVGVGHDVAGGIDDDAGADRLLADDESGLSAALFAQGAVSGDENLHHGGRNFGGEAFESLIELDQGLAGCFLARGGVVGSWLRLLGREVRGRCENEGSYVAHEERGRLCVKEKNEAGIRWLP